MQLHIYLLYLQSSYSIFFGVVNSLKEAIYCYSETSLKSADFSLVENKFVSPFKGIGVPEYYEQASPNLKLY